MNLKSNKKNISLLIVLILITTLLSSCDRFKKTEETNTESTIEKTTEQTVEPVEKTIEPEIKEVLPVEEVFDDTALGYKVENNKLLLNDKELPAGEIAEVTKETDRTTYHFYDGAALIVKSNGDMIVDFPIRITLLVDKDFESFNTLYRNNPLTNSPIIDFVTEDNWYTIDYGQNTKLTFNNTNLSFTTNNLEINQTKDSCETIFKDILISTSKIKSTDALSSIIKIDYEDGNQLTHIIGGSTTFIFKTGTTIESDGDTTTITKDEKTTVVKGDITSIDYDMETGEILIETNDESVTFNNTGEIIEQKSLVIEEEPIVEEPISEEAPVDEITTEPIEEALEDAVVPIQNLEQNQEFDQETLGTWDENEEINPFRIGVLANFNFMQKDSLYSDYGLRGDFIIENEVVDGIVIGLQIGLGADHFSTEGFYKQLTTFATFSQEFTKPYSSVSYFYKVALGSLIPISEGTNETPYFKLALSAGANFDIDDHWMFRLGAEAAINYRTSLVTTESFYAGLLYTFK